MRATSTPIITAADLTSVSAHAALAALAALAAFLTTYRVLPSWLE